MKVSVIVLCVLSLLKLNVLLAMLVACVVGGLVGGWLFHRVSVTWLRGLFAAFLLYGGVRYLL